jgi:hypothetical protein
MSAVSVTAGLEEQPDQRSQFLWRCGHDALTSPERAALCEAARRFAEADWLALCELALRQRMAPLAFKHVAEAGLLATMPAQVTTDLKRGYCVSLVGNRVLWRELRDILQAFSERECDAVPLKGISLAQRAYSAVALRPADDTDLLVKPTSLEACIAALVSLGYSPRPGSERLAARHAIRFQELIFTKEGRPPVELHTTLVRSPSYRRSLPLTDVWERTLRFTVDGLSLRRLHPYDELIYLCLHLSAQHHFDRLIWLVDIAQIVANLPVTWDWDGFAHEVIGRGVATPVALTLDRARAQLGAQAPPEVMRRLHDATYRARERASWRLAHAPFANPHRVGLHLLGLPTTSQRLAFAREMTASGLRRLLVAVCRTRR